MHAIAAIIPVGRFGTRRMHLTGPLFAIALALSSALASPPAHAQQHSVAFGQRLVSVGDSIGQVMDVAGAPASRVQLTTPQGGGAGERLEYYLRHKTVLIWVQGGRVVAIQEVLD